MSNPNNLRLKMKNLLVKCTEVPVIWKLLDKTLGTLSRGFRRIECYKRNQEATKDRGGEAGQLFEKLNSDRTVKNGPFKGLKYPRVASLGSTIYPKLLGSYEQELHEVVSQLIEQPYHAIVDIGCAEGYYAVGLGLHCSQATIYAFDIDQEAQDSCCELAELNGVTVQAGGFCDGEKLLSLDLGERSLIFADCESYEKDLFTSEVVKGLRKHDLLIELHDYLSLGIRPELMERFEKTHQCELIASVDDLQKVYDYDYPELAECSLEERLLILREGRPSTMWWLLAKARS